VRRPIGYLGSLDQHRWRAAVVALIAELQKLLGRVAPFGEASGGAVLQVRTE
jgi:hypothetical protein